jgi:hypothetical protein
MQRFAILLIVGFSTVLLFTAAAGCGKREATEPPQQVNHKPVEVKKTPLEVTPDGVLKGRVIYDGDPPVMEFLEKIKRNPDHAYCLKGGPNETHMPTWIVNKETRGVANVVVWLEPPPGKYFALTPEERHPREKIVHINQPRCAFVPHVAAVFPAYWDGTQYQRTGQFLRVTNSAPFSHAMQWNPTYENPLMNQTIPSKGHVDCTEINPQKTPLAIGCGLHTWMYAYLWVFDNPYHAVTGEDGRFEIDHVPSNVEVTFNAWHESHVSRPFEKKLMTFQKGENPFLEMKIKQ